MDWFETAYYDLLYKNRDENEAAVLIHRLFKLLPPSKDSIFLDVACGNGRHAAIMKQYGKVIGFDLCNEKINIANQRNLSDATFFCHDMLVPLDITKVDFAFNLFTSFGYFNDPKDDHKSLSNISQSMKNEAYFIQDYINIDYIKANIITQENFTEEGIQFVISRKIENNFVKKFIQVEEKGNVYNFEEQVRIYDQDSLKDLHIANGLIPEFQFGDYNLSDFNIHSPRLIIISKKQ
jgi:SAM-dependent methyltransferase